MKSLGIIGGIGPETSADFYLDVVFGCQKLNNTQHRPLIVMSSVPYPYWLENDEIINCNIGEQSKNLLITEAKRLEKSGIDMIAMPCNSLHVFINQIRESVKIPVISILEQTAKYIKANKFKKVGLISTSATVKYKNYESIFKQNDINFIVPNGLDAAKMDQIVQRLTDGIHLNKDRDTLLSVIEDLKNNGADSIALACTDLQLLLPKSEQISIFDTMKVLADAVVTCLIE
ncbi:MAG: amino acid racemase [Clostridiales bacterium]|jgi:aspartate racemase|nr:amino acid racemase [Clostridiales bacterium]